MSEKTTDSKGRWRTVTIAFRLSPEESDELNNRVKMCGFRTKREYIIQSLFYRRIQAVGNPLMLIQFRKNLQHIESELERLNTADDMDEELFTPIRTMLEILSGFDEKE